MDAHLRQLLISIKAGELGEVVIAVMGMTGSGKSSFIQRVSEKSSAAVGHGLASGSKTTNPRRERFPAAH